jgi:hypothetical protein
MSNSENNQHAYLTTLLRGGDMDPLVHRDVAHKVGIRWREEEDLALTDPFFYAAMVAVLNEKTVSYNRYFYKISNFLESFTGENMEFLDSVLEKHPLPPPGSGWRAIKRFLNKVDGEFRIRCSRHRCMVSIEHHGYLSRLGKVLEGEELAEEVWKRNLCLRTQNPKNWVGHKSAYLLTDTKVVDISLDQDSQQWLCYEIQYEGNDWPTEKQLEYYFHLKETCPYWAKVGWWSEDELEEYTQI